MTFPFLQLPTETRLPIYRLLLPYSEWHREERKNDCPVRWYPGKYGCSSILYVSRQIHREAAHTLYHENCFAIYVKHPREPRLPMNESRADPETFVLVSWAKYTRRVKERMDVTWAHPQNPRIPFSIFANHQNFHHIRNFHVSLPPFDDLAGVDMFMKKTSFAAFNGINAWVENCAETGGYLEAAEKERMSIVQQFKDPIDELGDLLQSLERIDWLCISVQAAKYQITFLEYLMEALLQIGPVGGASCFVAASMTLALGVNDRSQLRRWKDLLQSPPKKRTKESQLPAEADSMYRLLQAIRTYQQLDSVSMPDWLSPMPA